MRNIAVYPITKDEIVACLTAILEEEPDDAIGSIKQLCLREAIRIVRGSNSNGAQEEPIEPTE